MNSLHKSNENVAYTNPHYFYAMVMCDVYCLPYLRNLNNIKFQLLLLLILMFKKLPVVNYQTFRENVQPAKLKLSYFLYFVLIFSRFKTQKIRNLPNKQQTILNHKLVLKNAFIKKNFQIKTHYGKYNKISDN